MSQQGRLMVIAVAAIIGLLLIIILLMLSNQARDAARAETWPAAITASR